MRLSKRKTMVLALLLSVIGADVYAQEVVDSVWVDSVEVDSVAFADNLILVGKEEDFPAIDSLISARSYDVLSECMAATDLYVCRLLPCRQAEVCC